MPKPKFKRVPGKWKKKGNAQSRANGIRRDQRMARVRKVKGGYAVWIGPYRQKPKK